MFSFKELLNSDAYQKEAESWAKTFIFVSFAIAAYFVFFTEYTYGWNWIWIAPVLLFGSSLLLSMPAMILFSYLSYLYGKNVDYLSDGSIKSNGIKGNMIKFLKGTWSLVAPIICGVIVYYFLLAIA